jgi:large subunit ribosomal protein L21
MYAVFEDGSRQYRVSVGDRVRIDFRDVQVGQSVELNRVLLLADGANVSIGQPQVEGAKIIGNVTALPKEKTMIQKFRRRKNYRRLKGHTQPFVEVTIKHILKPGESAPSS